MSSVEEVAIRARAAARAVQALPRGVKDTALRNVAEELVRCKNAVLAANEMDMTAARAKVQAGAGGYSTALVKRLDLSGRKFDGLMEGITALEGLDDPVGKVTLARELDAGLELRRYTCPIGVIAVIFEARPEAAVQISSLAIKSANAVILKGGKEAEQSNLALVAAIRGGLKKAGMPEDTVQCVSTRDEIAALLKLDRHIDLVIPRGSNALVRYITDNTRIPVLGHADGICSVYVDAAADLAKAIRLTVDSKTQYPAVCNAAEQLLVHRDVAESHLPAIAAALAAAGVVLRADGQALEILSRDAVAAATTRAGSIVAAEEGDFRREFLDLEMGVQVVESVEEAVGRINGNGSHHTDLIITEDGEAAEEFLGGVDSAGVFHNASTRFADGFRYGFGAEVGVSTTKTHSRGPVGMDGLLIYKYRLVGDGHTVQPYATGAKSFTHRDLV